MKFYCTIEPHHKLRHVFSNLSAFYIIDVISLVKESGLKPDKPSHNRFDHQAGRSGWPPT